MATTHTGSWGTPDFGITEAIGDYFGLGRNDQGGSQVTTQVASSIGGNNIGTGSPATTANPNRVVPTSLAGAQAQTAGPVAPSAPAYNKYRDSNYLKAGTDINSPEMAWLREQIAAEDARNNAAYQQQLGQEIDSVYNPQFDYLNQTEQFYKNQLPGYQQEANQNYDVNKQLLGTSLTNAQTGINTQETTGKRATEDAMAKARRVFMEQQIGNQQRFGGSSSAGGAMSELLARNLQSEQGQIGRQATDYTQQIGQLRQQAQQKFDDSVLQLEQQKQKALNDIQREFDQKMMEIGSNRTQLTSAKAQMKLQALMDLRNQTFAVQQQEAQFKQALQMQLAQSQGSAGAGAGSLTSLQNQAGTAGQNYAGTLGANQYGLTSCRLDQEVGNW